jgi:predicted nucleic acid-binding protein
LLTHCPYIIFGNQKSRMSRKPELEEVGSRTAILTCRLDVTSDPDDNMFLECADAARADYLVTGNPKHFPRLWKNNQDHNDPRIH